jgi:hypothetical protein
MSSTPTEHDGGADHSAPRPPDGPPLLTAARKRSRRKKILTPLVLAVLGLALLGAAFILYPRPAESPAPDPTLLAITAPSTTVASYIGEISYTVDQVRPDVARLTVSLEVDVRGYGGVKALLGVTPPAGTTLLDCSHLSCDGKTWAKRLSFKFPGVATVRFFVKAHNFGVTSNGITAAAAIPEVLFAGSKGANLTVTYHIPSASSYDWSAYPPSTLSNSGATWDETVLPGNIYNGGDTVGRVASGINHTVQANNDTKIFIAGALLGLERVPWIMERGRVARCGSMPGRRFPGT